MKLAFLLAFLAVANSGAAKTWKVDAGTSLEDVNAWAVGPGDKVLFQRGGMWNGTLKARSGEAGRPVVYGTFGEGAKPLFTQCVDASGTNHWRRTFIKGLNALWETSPELSAALDADVGGLIGDAGPIMEGQTDDALFSKVEESVKLTGEKLFWYDAEKRRVVVRRFNTPDRLLGKVKLTLAKPIVDLSGCRHIVVDGLALRFGGADGFLGRDVEDVTIRNCDVSYVGGGMREGARFGSCIALGGNVRACILERNRLWQAYGAAVSVGERCPGEVAGVICRDNAVWKCMSAFHFGDAPAAVSGVTLEFNTCVDTGFAWAMFGPSGGKRLAAARILSLNLPEATADFAVRSNLFYRTTGIAVENCGKGKFSLDGNRYWLPQEWGHVDNAVYSEPASGLFFKCGEKSFRSFREKTGFEENGEFARPSFTDETRKDFRPYRSVENVPGVRGVPGIDEDQSVGNGGVYSTETLRSGIWSLKRDGEDEYVMRARARWNSPSYPGGEYAFANLEAADAVKLIVEVHDGRDLSNAIIQPAGVPVELRHVDAHTIELSVARPCKFTVEPDDNRVAPLFVFVNPPECDVPDANDPNVVYFGPGIHRVPDDLVRLKDGQTLYVARGAVLQAAVRAAGANIRICGSGVIDGSIFPHTWGRKGPQYAFVNFFKCRDLVMEDVTLLGSFHWTIYPEGCDRVIIRNVKLCGDRCCNDDGIDPSNTRDLLMENCFFRTQDDGVAVKGIEMKNGPCERITVTNSVFWCDFARIVCIGHESRAPYMNDIRFVDNDVLHYVRPLLLVEPGDNMPVSNVVFRNVRVHTDLHGRTEATMRIQPVVNDYTLTKTPGSISGVTVDGLEFAGTPIPLRFLVRGADPSRLARDVSISGVTVNGRRMSEGSSARPDSYLADDIWFDGEHHPDSSDPMFVRGPHVENVRF